MTDVQRAVYYDRYGAPHAVLIYEDVEPELGVPLLNLDSLDLPGDIEARLRVELWEQGIREYTDALQPGANEKIAAALRGALRMAVSNIVTLCRAEYDLLTGGK